jgi:hypothetical protein
MTRRRLLACVAAVVLLAGAAALGLFGRELRAWPSTARTQDALLVGPGVAPDAWSLDRSLDARAVRKLLDVADDVRFRQALALFRASRPLGVGAAKAGDQLQASAQAESELALIEEHDRLALRRSRAANMLAVLEFEDSLFDKANENYHLERALGDIELAIRADPAAAEAKENLELVLWLLGPKKGIAGGTRTGGGVGIGAKGAGFVRPGHGY